MRRAGDTYRRTGHERQAGKRRRDVIPIDDRRMRPRFSRGAPKLNYSANSEPRMRNERERWRNSEYDSTGANRTGRAYADHVRTRRDDFRSERPRIGDQDLHRAQNYWRNQEAGGARSKRAETSRLNPNRGHTNCRDAQFPATEVFVPRTVDQATARVGGVNKPAEQSKNVDGAVKQLLPAAGKTASSTATKRGLRIATVCANNMNRSMASHLILKNSGFNVQSFGTATQVRLPSASGKDHAFPFGTPYSKMLQQLRQGDESWYAANNIISMLVRNQDIKLAPQRWSRLSSAAMAALDLVICSEQRVFDKVTEEIGGRAVVSSSPVHVINLETIDDDASAKANAARALQLCKLCERCADLETDLDSVLEQFEEATGITTMSSTHYM